MYYERLTAADATFLRIETAHEPQHVGSVSVIDGTPLRDECGRVRFGDIRAHVGRRVHRVPRMRQRIMEVPYGQGRPVWIDDADSIYSNMAVLGLLRSALWGQGARHIHEREQR